MKYLEILEDDCFRETARILKIPEKALDKLIFNGLMKLDYFEDSEEHAGEYLSDIRSANSLEKTEFYKIIFFRNIEEHETLEFLESIKIMRFGAVDPCPECGSQLQRSEEGGNGAIWYDVECENHNCNYAWSSEPDWDSMQGGADYD